MLAVKTFLMCFIFLFFHTSTFGLNVCMFVSWAFSVVLLIFQQTKVLNKASFLDYI